MVNGWPDETPKFLPTQPAGSLERRRAMLVVLVSAAIFLAAAPFAQVPLAPITAFIPIYESALTINDLITAALLFSQFGIMGSPALLALACGYLFTAVMTVFHLYSFPGLFPVGGLPGSGSQTTAWLYAFWHGGFPLFVVAYALLHDGRRPFSPVANGGIRRAILAGMAATLLLACLAMLSATASHDALPPILINNQYTLAGHVVLGSTWALCLPALFAVWRRKPHSLLDLWLMVVMCAWVFDIALSAVLNAGRFDLGWYLGRSYGLLASSFVLLMLLFENSRLYVRLALAHEGEQRKAAERAAALEALNDKEREIRAVYENLVDCVITIDGNGTVRSANPALERLLGYPVTELIGKNVKTLMPTPHQENHDDYLARYRQTREARIIGINREVEGRHKDGHLIPLELSIGEYQIRGEQVFIGTLHDIRERKRFIAQIDQARTDAERANRAKSEFLAAMSHEIRTPMNGVIGMIDVLHQTSLKGYQVEMVDLIRESAYSLLAIIDDILDFSKIEAGKLEIETGPLRVADVVEKVCGMLDRLAERQQVELTLFIDPAIPAQVLGDGLRLRQVLINLTNNAIKFSSGGERPGRVAVRALLAEQAKGRATVKISVSDNGIGMDAATAARLFSPFTQGDISTTRRFGGTGLGLAISHRLAALMGGDISVASTPGEGATFTLTLGFDQISQGPADAEPPSPVAGLSCCVSGPADGLAADIATYLSHGGAQVIRLAETAAASIASLAAGRWIWIIDCPAEALPLDDLRAAAGRRPELDLRFVVIGRGQQRRPQSEDPDLVRMDGNVLYQRSLFNAVAIAAGCALADQEAQPHDKLAHAPTPPSPEEARRSGRMILAVEDNQTNQKVILQQLHLLGYAADVAANGREALQRWQGGGYAVLLTDLHMPEMDGYQLTEAIRAQERPPARIPIIALTANALRDEAERCSAAGMDDYLSKPARLSALQAMLEKWLPAATTPPTATTHNTAVDLGVLEALVGADPTVVRELLQVFRIASLETVGQLKASFQSGAMAQVSAAAHKLKSSARSIGALQLGDLSAAIEQAGKIGDGEQLAALLPQFENEWAAVVDYLNAL
ncbi:MAG TPA: MASE4 domain-containing protein [Rhodocyclaceae bacterium]